LPRQGSGFSAGIERGIMPGLVDPPWFLFMAFFKVLFSALQIVFLFFARKQSAKGTYPIYQG
jgi:hypothetical protein